MLVLTRKRNESIRIGDDIVVVVLEVRDDVVKLGIEAPPGRKILRSELYQAVQEENVRAARLDLAVMEKLNRLGRGKKSPDQD
ncbi:MAG: carbon storage regulator CsrA [Peptococcaceae bacterium]|nr:carbon storage regulator CsrA [Peptococcaceae bacterium]